MLVALRDSLRGGSPNEDTKSDAEIARVPGEDENQAMRDAFDLLLPLFGNQTGAVIRSVKSGNLIIEHLRAGVEKDLAGLLTILGGDNNEGRAARLRLCSTDSFACRYFQQHLRAGLVEDLAGLLTILGGDNNEGRAARLRLCSTDSFARSLPCCRRRGS
jgi:hypothetical protein